MSTIQVWVKEYDRKILTRLMNFFERQQEEEFEGKAYRYSSSGFRRKRKRIRREKINASYVYSQALSNFWSENQQEIIKFEKCHKGDY